MLREKKVLAFYYIWYATPWGTGMLHEWGGWSSYGYDPDKVTRGRREAAVPCFPLDGLYDSSSEYTIRRHLYQAGQAGVDGFIASWWGFPDRRKEGSKVFLATDGSLRKLLEVVPEGFEVTLYYETAKYGSEPVLQNVREDLARIAVEHCSHPRWMRVDGRPVVVIYGRVMDQVQEATGNGPAAWAEIREALRAQGHDLFLVGDSLDPAYAGVMDALHTYNPILATTQGQDLGPQYRAASAAMHQAGKIFAATVTPGFDHDKVRWGWGERVVEPRRDGGYYLASWDTALSCAPDWVFVTSWNEWYEASQIEPSVEYGQDYLVLTKQQSRRFKRG